MSDFNSASPSYFLGLDAGSISVKIALMDQNGSLISQNYIRHQGRPFAAALTALKDLTQNYDPALIHSPKITGVSATKIAPLLEGEAIGEVMALTLATARFYPKSKNLIDIGGEDTKLLWFSSDQGHLTLSDFAMNALCAAGTGSFLDQQAHRLKYDITEFGRLATKSQVPPRVAGRCSVFAKSDMIHLQQSATPDYEIIYGLCLAMARSIKSGLAQGRSLNAPVLFTGGVAANPGLIRALREILDLKEDELIVPESHFVFGAAGAALASIDSNSNKKPTGLNLSGLEQFATLNHQPPARLSALKRPSRVPGTADFNWDSISTDHPLPVYIGVDVGSVSTNVVLVTEDGRLVSRQYLPTSGRPLEAIAIGFSGIPPEVQAKIQVEGVCSTGSGRYLSADYLGADLTVNEITAQATAAVTIDPNVDTIFEIGGQDSKYISLLDGVIVDFMMNKACAAGTGSFLEEQADKLGLSIKGEFGEMALSSKNPVALGERCTVFMESDLVHHQQNGVAPMDLTAGLCHGIVANYLGRVVETRPIGHNIFFQGGTSFNLGVAAAFESRLGPITVPDNADVTGAMGAALIARDRRTWKKSRFVGFDLSTRKYNIKSFECHHCANHCEIRKVTVEGGQPFFYGSRCDRYEEDGGQSKKAPKWPDLFLYRAEMAFNAPEYQSLLAENKKNNSSLKKIGLIRTMFFSELGPFWSVFWAALGFEPLWSSPTNKSIIHRGCETTESDFCFPIKAAHGHIQNLIDQKPDHIFLPSLVNMPGAENSTAPDNAACPYAQSLAYTAPSALSLTEPLLLTGPVFFGEGKKPLLKSLSAITKKLGLSTGQTKEAMEKGLLAQKNFSQKLIEKGRESLSSLGPDDIAMVVVARPYNGFDPGLNLRLNQKLSDLGVLGLPMDFLPLSANNEEALSHYWRYGQKITSAAALIAQDSRLEGLYISNFGCGPDSFILHFFKHLLAGKPFLEIEIDEHSSDVGAVTRLEAFLDSLAARKARNQKTEKPLKAVPLTVRTAPRKDQTLYIPPMCDHTKPMAAIFRAFGLKAESLPESDLATIELGRSQTSGKECFPLILTVGDFIKLTKRSDFEPEKSALFMPSSKGPCRFGQYGRYLSLVMKRLGLPKVEVVSIDQTGGMYEALNQTGSGHSGASVSRLLWLSLAGTDLLQKALLYTRPREKSPGMAFLAYQNSLSDLERACDTGQKAEILEALAKAPELFMEAKGSSLPRPKVGLVGEIYVRHNRFANEDIILSLEELGAEVVAPPFTEWIYYVGYVNAMRAARLGDWKKRFLSSLTGFIQARDFTALAREWEDFFEDSIEESPIKNVVTLGERFLDKSFQGEAILSMGKGLEFYHHGARGLVNIMPFTCMPGMVVGGLTNKLRQSAGGMPTLNLAYDGQSQSNTMARLEAFMYQVHNFKNPNESSAF